MKTWILGALTLSAIVAACSNQVNITAETGGTTSSSSSGTTNSPTTTTSSGTTNTQGSGGTSTTSSSGTGGSTSSGKLVTADSDMAQYQSISVDLFATEPVLQGPFFVTDVFSGNTVTLATVTGSDCSAATTPVLTLPTVQNSNGPQVHGIRLPVLAGQSLCHLPSNGGTLTVLGFKPY